MRGVQKKSRSVMERLFAPLCVVLAVLIVVMIGAFYYGGVIGMLEKNAIELLNGQVSSRQTYLENQMIGSWASVGLTVEEINSAVTRLAAAGEIDPAQLESDKDGSVRVMDAAAPSLISMLRRNRVTGAYLVLSNGALDPAAPADKRGLYLRDLDPDSSVTVSNDDLLLKRAPTALVKALDIATDSDWMPQFAFAQQGYLPSFAKPYSAARDNPDVAYYDLGFWSDAYTLAGDSREVLSYSVPLILPDGTIYGVLGAEITLDYLRRLMPPSDLANGSGSYILAHRQGSDAFRAVLINGSFRAEESATAEVTQIEKNNFTFHSEAGDKYYAGVARFSLYNTNTPFAGDGWVLAGVVDARDLFAFSNSVQQLLLVVGLVVFLLGLLAIRLLCAGLTHPIIALSVELERSAEGSAVCLSRTGIAEIDRMTAEIELLSDNVLQSSRKFADILEMASVRLGGFEYDCVTGALFLTEGFFGVFRSEALDSEAMSFDQFEQTLASFAPLTREHTETENGSETLYEMWDYRGDSFWVRLRRIHKDGRIIGLAEDVTAATLERKKIEDERDHDPLTGLLGRRAFHSTMRRLFNGQSEQLGCAALLMFDLDNLKYVNDTYGHDYGDRYICKMAEGLSRYAPPGTIVSRQSGDEMFLFLYGYDSTQQIRNLIRTFKRNLRDLKIELPDGKLYDVSASGGIAWYPDDSTSYEQLIRYADFAMYEVKRSGKGELADFDMNLYRAASRLQRCREELNQMLAQERVFYHFQPIVDTRTCEVFAYEALMRSDMETLRSPLDILEVAAMESKLNKIERLTLFQAMRTFVSHMEAGVIPEDCRVFINSIPNQLLEEEDIERFEKEFEPYLTRLVIELTESERVRENVLVRKREFLDKWGAQSALDDYGSGYNSDVVLLSLSPNFVKIDMSILRGIDKDADKQTLVGNLISYAHGRNILLIAEGIETRAELETIMHMGVRLVQGYFIARPALQPPTVQGELADLMRQISAKCKNGDCINAGQCSLCERRLICPNSSCREP